MRRAGSHAVIGAIAAATALWPWRADAAPVLREAAVSIVITSPTSCEVAMTLTVDGIAEIEHRIESFGAASDVQLVSVGEAAQVGDVRTIGRTQSLVLRPSGGPYTVRYRVQQTAARASRCPIWLPTVPTDGRSRVVRLRITLPSDAVPGSVLPAFKWEGQTGSVTLGHLPAFVRAPYTLPGEPTPWGIASLMDLTTVIVFVVASAMWIWQRRR